MRANGTVVYYEKSNGTGFVRTKNNGEFYLLTNSELRPTDLIIYEGLEVSFHPIMDNHETIAKKVKTAAAYKTGHITNIMPDQDLGYVSDESGNVYWFKPSNVILSGNKKIQRNDRVQFFGCNGGNHPVQYAYEIATDNRTAIEKFSHSKSWDVHIRALAALAQEENWGYANYEAEPYPLLKNYFKHTFQRVFDQQRIGYFINKHSQTAYACFHTGLVSKNNEDIYGIFVKDTRRNPDPYAMNNWAFTRFTDSWVHFLLQCENTPRQASYNCTRGFDTFDASLEIKSDINTILEHQEHLLPKSFLRHDDEHCARQVKQAIDHTVQLIAEGTVIPVPKYFFGTIEFVAPLYFNGSQADTALVIKRKDHNIYFAHNLIPLEVAYKNARLLGPVVSEWLKPVCFFHDLQGEI